MTSSAEPFPHPQQDPLLTGASDPAAWWEPLRSLGWFDWTAIAVVLVFVALGLRRGALWQLSRVLTLVLAYACAIRFSPQLTAAVRSWFASSTPAAPDGPSLALYLTTIVIFLGVVVLVSCLALLLERFARQEEHSVADRLVGAGLGLLTGGLLIGALLGCLLMFTGGGTIGQEVRASHSMAYGRHVVTWFGERVPAPIRGLFAESDQQPDAEPQPR